MSVVILYAIVILLANPYQDHNDDNLAKLAQAELFLLLLAGYVFASFQSATISEQDDLIMSICLITAAIFFFLFFLAMGIRVFKSIFMTCLQARRKRLIILLTLT